MKKIALNGHVRSEIIRSIMQRWRAEHPRPAFSGLPTAEQAREINAIKHQESQYRHALSLALGTFRTVHELIEEWPEIEAYVPEILVEPRKHIILPALP